ncbi:MAG: AmmeMemoRadiSam system protein B [Pirellulales bacterium]|nr:AmmeMemoRadiSam system protein B [Pirellulales bacterium]
MIFQEPGKSSADPHLADWVELDDRQAMAIHEAACEIIASAVQDRPQQLDDPTLAGTHDRAVLGVYTSVKRRGRLRACCGLIGSHPIPLLTALETAALRSATEDPRLPPISPTELPFLDIATWLLFGLRRITSDGDARANDVEIGRHGLRIYRGHHAGLLLPGVATDYGYNAREFLHHVCLKAGLPTTAWREADTQLDTFEGRVFGGPFARSAIERSGWQPAQIVPPEELDRLRQFCRATIGHALRNTTPNYYDPACADGMIYGAILSVKLLGTTEKIIESHISLRPAMPMQSTLFQLAQAMGRRLQEKQGRESQIESCELTILHDPAMHGTATDCDVRGIDPCCRAVMVRFQQEMVVLMQPGSSPEKIVIHAANALGMTGPADCAVYSYAAQTTDKTGSVSSIPWIGNTAQTPSISQTMPLGSVRQPVIAGTFYPGHAETIALELDRLFSEPKLPRSTYRAVLIPHAGWRYSGQIAARVLARVQFPDTAIILGPKHTREGVNWAIAPYQYWNIPGSSIESDLEIASSLAQRIPEWQVDGAAHEKEHCIEVQLPLIRHVAPNTRIVGVVLGMASYEQCQRFGAGLAKLLRDTDREILLVISSDMNHYASDSENRRLDEMVMEAIQQGDPEAVFKLCRTNAISVCGLVPCVVVMEALRQLNWANRIERVAYATSADVSGDSSRVVGYAGMLFSNTLQ